MWPCGNVGLFYCHVAQLVEQNETEAKAKGVSLSGGSNPPMATQRQFTKMYN